MFDETRSTLSGHDRTTVHGPADSAAGTDGFAVASFVCGLVGLVPFAAVLGICALVRIGRTDRSGRGMAVAGLVLSVLWLAIGAAEIGPRLFAQPIAALAGQTSAGKDYIHVMGAGDCFDSSADGEHVTKVPCEQPHDEQIFGRIDVGDGTDTYPGLEALREPALTTCRIAASAYFTTAAPPGLEFFVHLPTRGSWTGGVRTAACTFGKPGEKLTTSVHP